MISVIIPTYNRSATIERSVRSVLNQTYSDLECIVVDDGSTDDTEAVVKSIKDDRLKYYRLEHNSGACAARNRGIDLAQGEFIGFQDSDDEWIPEKLEIQLYELQFNKADVCFCAKIINSRTEDFSYIAPSGLMQGFVDKKRLYPKSIVSTQTIFARKKVFISCRFDENVKKAQDYEWTIRASEMYTFYFVSQPLVLQYLQTDSITVEGRKKPEIEKEMSEYFLEKFAYTYESNKYLYVALLSRTISCKLNCGDDVTGLCWRLFCVTRSPKAMARFVLSKIGLLNGWRKLRNAGNKNGRNIERALK